MIHVQNIQGTACEGISQTPCSCYIFQSAAEAAPPSHGRAEAIGSVSLPAQRVHKTSDTLWLNLKAAPRCNPESPLPPPRKCTFTEAVIQLILPFGDDVCRWCLQKFVHWGLQSSLLFCLGQVLWRAGSSWSFLILCGVFWAGRETEKHRWKVWKLKGSSYITCSLIRRSELSVVPREQSYTYRCIPGIEQKHIAMVLSVAVRETLLAARDDIPAHFSALIFPCVPGALVIEGLWHESGWRHLNLSCLLTLLWSSASLWLSRANKKNNSLSAASPQRWTGMTAGQTEITWVAREDEGNMTDGVRKTWQEDGSGIMGNWV